MRVNLRPSAGIAICITRYLSRRQEGLLSALAPENLPESHPILVGGAWHVLRWEGRKINSKRELRLYREENLKPRACKRMSVNSALRIKYVQPTATNHMWAMYQSSPGGLWTSGLTKSGQTAFH